MKCKCYVIQKAFAAKKQIAESQNHKFTIAFITSPNYYFTKLLNSCDFCDFVNQCDAKFFAGRNFLL